MAASVDGLQFHRALQASLDTINPKSLVQYDKRRPELWNQFWHRAQAIFDDAGLLRVVVDGQPTEDDLARIITYHEFEGEGLGPDPQKTRDDLWLQMLSEYAAESRKAYNMLVPMLVSKDPELADKLEELNETRDANALFVYLRDDASPKVEKRWKKTTVEWATAILMAFKGHALPFSSEPTSDAVCAFFAALHKTYVNLVGASGSTLVDGHDYFSIALPILRRVSGLENFAFHAEMGGTAQKPKYASYKEFAVALRKYADDHLASRVELTATLNMAGGVNYNENTLSNNTFDYDNCSDCDDEDLPQLTPISAPRTSRSDARPPPRAGARPLQRRPPSPHPSSAARQPPRDLRSPSPSAGALPKGDWCSLCLCGACPNTAAKTVREECAVFGSGRPRRNATESMLNYMKLAVEYVKAKKLRTLAGVQVRRGMLKAMHERMLELSESRNDDDESSETDARDDAAAYNQLAGALSLLGACDLDACDADAVTAQEEP